MSTNRSVLDALDEQQRAAAECVAGPVVIYAGAGTGKTRTITHRIAHSVNSGVVDPSAVLAVTFTTRAAGELRARLLQLGVNGVQVRTFHSAAYRQLRFFYPQTFSHALPQLISSKFDVIRQAAAEAGIGTGRELIRDLSSEIEWAKVNMCSPEHYRETGRTRELPDGVDAHMVARIFETYLDIMDENNAMDYEDVLLMMTALINNHADIAASIHKQYRHFTVDEFQDVSPIQFELLSGWLGQRNDVCVVGDPAQTIYSFSGATSQYLRNFDKHFPQAQKFELTQSYRSTRDIVTLANKVLAHEPTSTIQLKATRSAGTPVEIKAYDSDAAQAEGVALRIVELIGQGVNAQDIAVLFRTNAQSEVFESALAEHKIPVVLRGAERFFDRPEVKQAILHIRTVSAGRNDRSSLDVITDAISSAGWVPTMPHGRAALETWESLNTLRGLATEFIVSKPGAQVADFIAHLEHRQEIEHAPTPHAVTLASIHAAKGLEWKSVFVVGCSEGLLPLSHAESPEALAEERRLFYVAATRASDTLQLSWAKHRDGGQPRTISRFISEVTGNEAQPHSG